MVAGELGEHPQDSHCARTLPDAEDETCSRLHVGAYLSWALLTAQSPQGSRVIKPVWGLL